jgi:hypothetical protein
VSFSPTRGFSFGGANDRLNVFQLDGTSINDLKSGQAGGEGNLTALPPEAIEEIQINTAPFDVRNGNFAGGQISAVSKSGTNRWQGTVFGNLEAQSLNGSDPDGTRGVPTNRKEAGVTVGGPLVHDRLAGFLTLGGLENPKYSFYRQPGSDTTGGADSAGVGIRYATMVRFQDILRGYGVEPGTFGPRQFRVSERTGFAKLTAQLGLNSRLELSHDHRYNKREIPYTFGFNAGLSSNAEEDPTYGDVTRLSWTAAFGTRWSNELLLARNAGRHRCVPRSDFATIMVSADAGSIVAGGQEFCRGQENGQSLWELTDNVGLAAGDHHLTFGTHHELVHVYDQGITLENSIGRWSFPSLDALEQGQPDAFFRDIPGPDLPASGRPDFRAVQIGFYAQDQWSLRRGLTVTGGLRLDIPFLPTAPGRNAAVFDSFGINTARTPSGHALWSPRVGVNYDVTGSGRSFLRGGIGLFAGRPAFAWLEEAYSGTGLQSLTLQCFGDAVPVFTIGPDAPTECGDGERPVPRITAFDPGFRYPQNLKIVLGADQRLPWDVVGTVDLVYTRGVHQFALRDVNLGPPAGSLSGEGGRTLYGTFDDEGIPVPNRLAGGFEQVVRITNGSGDRAYSLAFQLQKRFANGNELTVSYTHTDAKSRQDTPDISSIDNLTTTPVDGTLERPNLRTSLYSVPHQVRWTATMNLPLKLRLGLLYAGQSGGAFTYTVIGDANADGLGGEFFRWNDPVYVPRDAGDVTLASAADPSVPAGADEYANLMRYVAADRCLREQRGQVVRRNSCRQPWDGELDARLSEVVPLARGHAVEVSTDLFNVLNFLDRYWGRKRSIDGTQMLELVGYDAAHDRGIYIFHPPTRRAINADGTRWQARLGVKYAF